MNEYELYHHGVKGQKHGERRYQSKDGTWTPLGLKMRRAREGSGDSKREKREGYFAKKKRIKNEKAAEAKARREAIEKETMEERRARMLKSTDARELYKNRDLLTTAEINERINRIDTEAKLSKIAASTKKTGLDYADKFLAYGRKANEIYEFTQKPICKALAKQMGFNVKTEAPLSYKSKLKNINKLSNKEVQELASRARNEENLRKFIDKYIDGGSDSNNQNANNNKKRKKEETSSLTRDDILDLFEDELSRRGIG